MTTVLSPQVGLTPYAVAGDFCRIFHEHTDALYQLSFLLTADSAKAEQCFVSGLDDCHGSSRVFKEWADSWARRVIVQNAIRLIQPIRRQDSPVPTAITAERLMHTAHAERLASLFRLTVFERFVFVMSVLEQYSDQDCKSLLECSRQDVVRARAKALIKMAAVDSANRNQITAEVRNRLLTSHFMPQTA